MTTNLEVDTKDTLSKAYALYLRDLRVKPKDALSMHISLKMLLPNLQRFDTRWLNIPASEMKTSPPRTLVQRMNCYLTRFKRDVAAV